MVPNATPGSPGLPRELPLVGRREELERRFAELTQKAHVELSAAEKQEFRDLQQQLAEPRA